MSQKIKQIRITDKSYSFSNSENKSSDLVGDLSKMNIFVAQNNSGKSRFIRSILNSHPLDFIPTQFSLEAMNIVIQDLKNKIIGFLNQNRLNNKDIAGNIPQILELTKFTEERDYYNETIGVIQQQVEWLKSMSANINGWEYPRIGHQLEEIYLSNQDDLLSMLKEWQKIKFEKMYFPTLRGMRPFQASGDIYKDKTIRDYFSEADSKIEIHTGLSFFTLVKNYLLGDLSQRELVSDYQQFLGDAFFEGKKVALIPKEETQTLTLKIGDEKEQQIERLGDGLQSIITITLPLFLNKGKDVLAFIEEPEINLHPGHQRRLLEVLLKTPGFGHFQYFITTHSNHFLDMAQDEQQISIFSISKNLPEEQVKEKEPTFTITRLQAADDHVLSSLGVSNSSVFLTNCTIWVEGISDRYYLSKYLSLYQENLKNTPTPHKKLLEDIHFSFVEYSGNNITHWLDVGQAETINIKRLCGKAFLIADSDGGKKTDRAKALKTILDDRFYLLKCREIENTLSKKVLRLVVAKYEGIAPNKISEDFTEEQYRDVYLGEFIETTILNGKKKRKGTYKTDSGTVVNKYDFCQKAISHIQSWDDLSDEAKQLTKLVYDFICRNNMS